MERGTPDRPRARVESLSFLAGGGEMGERMRSLDWSSTPLGPVDTWPQSLRSPVSMLLPSKAQIVLFWGPEFVVLYNDAYRQVFGAKHPHVLGRPGREAWSEIWDQQLHALFAGVVRTGEAFWAKDMLFFLERNGFKEETYFHVSYDPVRDESGAVGGLFCIVTETTERVVGERRMSLLNALAARNAVARTAQEACELAIETLAAHPQDVTFAQAYIDKALQCETPHADEHRAASQPGLVRELLIPSTTSDRPEARFVVGLNAHRPFDDQYCAFIDLVVDQLSLALTNARAHEEERRRADALAEVDRAKTAFFNNVSHEFRTPLTLLLGPLEDAMASPDRALGGEALATAHRNAQRLLKLVNTLLDFARIEAGRADAFFEPTDLDAFTSELAGAFRSAVESAGLRFDVDCRPLGQSVDVDRAMWEKIVFNLLSNALKFTFTGGVKLSLMRSGDDVCLTVSDSGSGIATEQLPQVFERFHRVRGTRSRTHEGTGIGLALVRELVRLHGGSIAVASEEGTGTTFTVTMPLSNAHRVAATDGSPRATTATPTLAASYVNEALGWTARPSAPAASTPGSLRILLADDNADMLDYVARLLGDRWTVETVSDGASALAAIHARRPDAIVTDVMMPEIDGFELLRAVKDDKATSDIPVILVSARAGEEAALEAVSAGADDYIVKPFTARDLVARVDAQLQRAAERQRARQQLIEANRIKDEFLATLSHELRTPLNAILGWAHLLKAPTMRAGMLERALESIDRNARAQARLVDDLLDVSRVISGKLAIKHEPVNLRAVILEAVDAVRPAMTAKALKMRVGVATDADIVIDGDGDRLRQVLANLLSNAVKFTPSGGDVEVDLRRVNGNVEIVVRDTGMGIAREFLPHVFERFRQADSAPARRHGGLGLGLAIARHLVEAHGGSVTAQSDGPGTGARFTIRLPVASARPRALPMVEPKTPEVDQLIAGLRVLVADDEPDAREVMRAALERHGGTVVSVASANEALAALRQESFDALVADIGMPEQDGYSLMRSIRGLPANEGGRIPSIAVTAYATLREREDAIGAGFDAHMGKPFNPDKLAATLAQIAKRGVSL